MRVLALLAFVGLVAGQGIELPYTECCVDCIAVDGVVRVDPDPTTIPIPGNVTVIVSGTLTQTVEKGDYLIQVRVLGIEIERDEGSICEDLEGIECPLEAGPINIVQEAEIPIRPPFGARINVHVEAVDQDQNDIICADFVLPV